MAQCLEGLLPEKLQLYGVGSTNEYFAHTAIEAVPAQGYTHRNLHHQNLVISFWPCYLHTLYTF